MNYYAHYDRDKKIKQLLHEHLEAVGKECSVNFLPVLNFSKTSRDNLLFLSKWIGLCHDFGKYTEFFQEYLINNQSTVLKNHAHISACYLFNYLQEKFPGNLQNHNQLCLNFIAYLAVRLHHGNLSLYGLFNDNSDTWEILSQQAKHLLGNKEKILHHLPAEMITEIDKYKQCLDIDRLKNDRSFVLMPKLMTNRFKHPEWYFILIYLFSLLTDGDKLNTAGLKKVGTKSVNHQKVKQYIYSKKQPDERKEKARESIINKIQAMTDEEISENCLYTLTAPTGIGKTLAALESALLLQERINKVLGYTPRIITAIPFINIIEQTRQDYENILSDEVKILVNHQLAGISTNQKVKEEYKPLEKVLMEIESWEVDIILTTFVQLFHSIITGKNRALKKFNKLAGSIVILDEVQALPEKYLPLIGAIILKLAEYFGVRFILMTATQPKVLEFGRLLLDKGKDYFPKVELLSNHEIYFEELKRTKFIPLLEQKMSTEEFINIFQEKWPGNNAALIVVNTIKRSIDIYNQLVKKVDVEVLYLSTNIIPLHRKQVIDKAKELLKNKKPFIMVSTQTIEAGVDLDFDLAFRDIAPLESLVQTAGRVNREGKKGEFLPVYIMQLESDNQHIYKLHNLYRTKNIFKDKKPILETEYRELINEYYVQALKQGVFPESRCLWEEGIVKLNFEKIEGFELIEKTGDVIDVFVELNQTATQLADEYEKIISMMAEKEDNNLFNLKATLKNILSQMSFYMINIRAGRLIKNLPVEFSARNNMEANFYWIPPGQINDYYDIKTGFKDESGLAFL